MNYISDLNLSFSNEIFFLHEICPEECYRESEIYVVSLFATAVIFFL